MTKRWYTHKDREPPDKPKLSSRRNKENRIERNKATDEGNLFSYLIHYRQVKRLRLGSDETAKIMQIRRTIDYKDDIRRSRSVTLAFEVPELYRCPV